MYSPCHVPRASDPSITGIDRVVLVSVERICEVISSGPSAVWRNPSPLSGTSRSKKSRRSSVTSGSAFSCITSEQEVCWTKTVSRPFVMFCFRNQSLTGRVNGYSPLPRVFRFRVVCEVCNSHSNVLVLPGRAALSSCCLYIDRI